MLAQQAGKVWKGAKTLEGPVCSRWLDSSRLARIWLSSLHGRGFSAQPAPIENYEEELKSILPEPQQQPKVPQTYSQAIGKWDRFVYTLYHLRAKASAEAAVLAGAEGSSETYLSSLLPVTLLLEPKSRGKYPLSEWVRELQKELDCQALTRQKLEEKVDNTLKRGGATELRSSHALIRQLQGPMTDAIIREQRSILRGDSNLDRRLYGPFLLLAPAHILAHITIHRILSASLMSGVLGLATLTKSAIDIGHGIKVHVNTELTKGKSKRLRAQHQKLQKKLKSDETFTSYKDWIKEFGIPLDEGPHNEEFDKRLLETCMALRAYDLPDPAKWRPQDPVSDVAISLTASADSLEAASRDDELWAAEEAGVLDVVEARAKGLRVISKKARLKGGQRVKIEKLQEHLNRLLLAARSWSTTKEAKIGARLIDLAMKTLFISQFDHQTKQRVSVPILEHHMIAEPAVHPSIKVTGMLRIHDDVVNQLVGLKDIIYLQNSIFDPMTVPPLPWKGSYFGGHLLQHDMVVRLKSTSTQLNSIEEIDKETPGLSKIYHSLNCLQSVPWRINKDVLEVAEKIYQSKEEICGMPRRDSLPIIPVKKRHRFVTWAGGNVPEAAVTDYARAEEDMLDEISKSYRNRRYGTGQIKRPWHETHKHSTRMQPQPESVSAYVANMEPNVPNLVTDADEGTNLWRHRVRGNRRRFMRKQLLVTSATGETLQELRLRRVKNADIRKTNREIYSQLCDLAVKLAVGERYKDEKAIYFPHNLDFRGRAYTLHPHLTHLGADICRGILEFAEGKPLGEHGLEWLFIQFTNTWGQGEDKRSFEGRKQFAVDHLYDIMESARAPMENLWWQQAEDPFQALAAAQNIRAAIVSGDPATHVSHAPVMMDGSCNGLQHYAALGLDKEGGSSVNMVRAGKPQDVYSEVARLVKQSAKLDAVNGSILAQKLLPFLDRSLVKQTVMTSVYGVTMLGAKDQIAGKLKDRGFGKKECSPAGAYAAKKTLNGLNQRFKEAMRVMAWLSACAANIAASEKLVHWKTPLGLPVVQPYRSLPRLHVQTTLQRVILQRDVKEAKIKKSKQRTAFPPNFVHSIDSSHMLMTAAACTQAGLRFAGVHDSFWTHAQGVPDLNRILREQFIELYSQPILENLKKHFQEQYPGVEIPELPRKGDLDIHTLLDATYFFS